MAMLAGVNIPDSQRIEIALTAVAGIGRSTSKKTVRRVAPRSLPANLNSLGIKPIPKTKGKSINGRKL